MNEERIDVNDANEANVAINIEDQQKEMENHLEQLKHTVVNNQNMELIKQKLILTQNHRDELLKQIELDLKFRFPFFFTNPELVRAIYFLELKLNI